MPPTPRPCSRTTAAPRAGRSGTVREVGRSSRRCSMRATTRGTRSTGPADLAMDLRSTAELDAFRAEARDWLVHALDGEFRVVRGRGGPGDEHALFEERHAWEKALGAAGWTCLQWPKEDGGRGPAPPAPGGFFPGD